MKETFEFRINNKYAHLLLQPINAKSNGSNTVIKITRDNPNFEQIRKLNREIREENDDWFFLYSAIRRKYAKEELDEASLLMITITSIFEPAGEECGTVYDESEACVLCGANRKRIGELKLKRGTIPKKDIAISIAGEIVVSERFAEAFEKRGLRGAHFERVMFNEALSNYYSLEISSEVLELSEKTIAGVNVFDLSIDSELLEFKIPNGYKIKLAKEVYKCPKGHTIGLNLLSQPYVKTTPSIDETDIFKSSQKVGVKRGLLNPEPLYFCSPSFKRMIDEEKLGGFIFEPTQLGK